MEEGMDFMALTVVVRRARIEVPLTQWEGNQIGLEDWKPLLRSSREGEALEQLNQTHK